MSVIRTLFSRLGLARSAPAQPLPNEEARPTSETGFRPTPENRVAYLYRQMYCDPALRAAIMDIRRMDREDGRVKKLHGRMARSAVKGGLKLEGTPSKRITAAWKRFEHRLQLHNQQKLESDCRGLVMEGSLPMQWVLGPDQRVVAGVRMPTETLLPKAGANGRFINPEVAYEQIDLLTGMTVAQFPLWQLTLVRLTPDNYDDMGALGRPYLDASRSVWLKLQMTDEDLVIRRRTRAPLRLSHVLEGASAEDLDIYRAQIEDDQKEITTDFFSNRKGSVTAVQGDANLEQIADVSYLLDTFYAGSPAPKGLFGYSGDLSRDILEDLKRDYFEEIDALQDTLSAVYDQGFRLDLLLAGINPEAEAFEVVFAERRTETLNQAADRALKYQALGVPPTMVWEAAGLDSAEVKARKEQDAQDLDPYPEPDNIGRVNVTPGNGRKGESGTTISTRGA
ncbi:MAG: portal protein [Chromatocurvus sp.]